MEMVNEYFTIILRRLGFKLLLNFHILETEKTEFQQSMLLIALDLLKELLIEDQIISTYLLLIDHESQLKSVLYKQSVKELEQEKLFQQRLIKSLMKTGSNTLTSTLK